MKSVELNFDRVLDKRSKPFFLRNKALYEKILFHIFYSVFHVESPPSRLWH